MSILLATIIPISHLNSVIELDLLRENVTFNFQGILSKEKTSKRSTSLWNGL